MSVDGIGVVCGWPIATKKCAAHPGGWRRKESVSHVGPTRTLGREPRADQGQAVSVSGIKSGQMLMDQAA